MVAFHTSPWNLSTDAGTVVVESTLGSAYLQYEHIIAIASG